MARTHSAVLTEPLMGASPLLQEELALEKESSDRGIERYYNQAKDAIERGTGAGLKPAERLVVYWIDGVQAMLEHERNACLAGTPGVGRAHYGFVISEVNLRRAACAALYHSVSMMMEQPGGLVFVKAANRVGRAVFAEWCADKMKQKDKESKEAGTRKHAWESLTHKCRARWKRPTPEKSIAFYKRAVEDDTYNLRVVTSLGAQLWSLLHMCCVIPEEGDRYFPAFKFGMRAGHRGTRFVEMDERVHRIIEEGHAERCMIRPRFTFMLVPPMPWVQNGDIPGGYLKNRTPLVSRPSRAHKDFIARTDMTPVFDSLNALQRHGWRINKKVMRVVEQMWRDGDVFDGVPNPNDVDRPARAPEGASAEEVRRAKQARASVYSQNVALKSERTAFISMLNEAQRFSEKEALYAPHQMCFRNRCYPLPSALNHHSADVQRGMLMFSQADELTDNARRWLLIHAANCWGQDKVPYDDRVEWACDNLNEMAKMASDPIEHQGWKKADKPFQFLATCIGLFDDEVGARIPYQADGTCNGLQQYAAIGRDADAAALVNLVHGDRPSDVYTAVLNVVLEKVKEDALAGNNLAIRLLPHLNRKTIKQPVMTVVYGVTQYGATDQLYDQLTFEEDTDKRSEQAKYLVRIVTKSIGDVMKSAERSMKWLSGAAHALASDGHHVEWLSPIGGPCRQDYSVYARCQIETVMGRVEIPGEAKKPKIGKQASAFPPNYIHSVDASHMMMTAKRCTDDGMPFSGVHDAFWTTAAHADRLHYHLRESFVKLHSRPLMQELHQWFAKRYPATEIPPPPEMGTYDVNDIRAATYAFH